MKKTLWFICAIICVFICTTKVILAQNIKSNTGVFVKELSSTKWNTPEGIPYVKAPGVNLGVTSFELLDENRIAYLSNATNEIIFTKTADGVATNKFLVSSAPRDFVYGNGFFYVLFERQVTVYDENGKTRNSFSFPDSYMGVERITRYNNETYLLLPSGNCVKIESSGKTVTPQEYEGWITMSGNFIFTKLKSDNSYSIKILTKNEKSDVEEFFTDKKVAGVYVVGATENKIILDVQEFISESPIVVKRNIVSMELDQNKIGSIVFKKKVPDCYFVLSNKDICVLPNGNIIHMITAPQGVFVFSLTESKLGSTQEYPANINDIKYHFNDHLIKVDEK